MNQLPTSFPYQQLHGMSFSQLFSLVSAMARWKWALRREQSLVWQRAGECCLRRVLQPAYAAVFLCESGSATPETSTAAGEQTCLVNHP
jgi:hypothetical protein